MEQLGERRRKILGAVVREYIKLARPIGSDTICQCSELGVSPATIRNEFGALTEMGYIAQPHTSAGRVPTAKGYRYFVEQLMEESELPPSEQMMIRHQFHQVTLDPDEWMKLAAAALAHAAQSAALIAAPQARQVFFRHVELISVSEWTGLMVLVLQDRTVHQQMMVFARPVAQEDLSRVADKLNKDFANMGLDNLRSKATGPAAAPSDALEAEIIQRVLELMSVHETRASREIYRDGLMNILQQPEFEEIQRAREIVQVLEQNAALESIFSQAELANGVQVIIGGEGRWDEIRDCSVVLSGYGLPGEAKGVLGVLGPMRMPYGRAIPAVRYVAQLLNSLVQRLYQE